jgi:hypothetical protein
MVPCFALCAFAAWRGVDDPLVLGALALVEIGLSGYLAFWAWFLSPHLGHAISVLLPTAGTVVLIWFVPKLNATARSALKRLAVPALLTFCASLMVLAAGFLYGGMESPIATQRTRFSHPLMGDNALAFIFAGQVHSGHIKKPMIGDWQSSDRPPLQTGMVLGQWPFLSQRKELAYSIVATVSQSLWMFALWLLLGAFEVNRRAASLVLTISMFSGFAFLNSFYVWPKLFGAAFMIAFSAFFLPPGSAARLRDKPLLAAIPGALLALGVLSHGASFFAAFGIAVAALLLRLKVPFKQVALMACVCALLYLPWTLYQKLFDPPGDRLLKWHLAGVTQVDPRPFLQVLTSSYRHLTFSQLLYNREQSGGRFFDHVQEYWGRMGHLVPALLSGSAGHARVVELLSEERVLLFFYLFPALGFLILGPLALAAGFSKRYRSVEWLAGFRMWLYVFCVLVVCWVLMFPPEGGVIFVQPYVTALLAFAGSTLALWSVSRWLALAGGALQITLNVLAYGIYMREPGTPGMLTEGALQYGNLALFFAAVVGFIVVLPQIGIAKQDPT